QHPLRCHHGASLRHTSSLGVPARGLLVVISLLSAPTTVPRSGTPRPSAYLRGGSSPSSRHPPTLGLRRAGGAHRAGAAGLVRPRLEVACGHRLRPLPDELLGPGGLGVVGQWQLVALGGVLRLGTHIEQGGTAAAVPRFSAALSGTE